MNIRLFTISVIIGLSLLSPRAVQALNMEQFMNICHSSKSKCSEHPILRTYVGGALDLIAVLQEDTKYIKKVYCKEPKKLFNVPVIINFMIKHKKAYNSRNAMLLVLRYLEEKGGC